MTDIVDVIRAVSELVERVFGAPPITKDITEGFALIFPVPMCSPR